MSCVFVQRNGLVFANHVSGEHSHNSSATQRPLQLPLAVSQEYCLSIPDAKPPNNIINNANPSQNSLVASLSSYLNLRSAGEFHLRAHRYKKTHSVHVIHDLRMEVATLMCEKITQYVHFITLIYFIAYQHNQSVRVQNRCEL